MSKGTSTGSAQSAARTHGTPSHRSRPHRTQNATGPAEKPSPGTPQKLAHAGYTGERVDRNTLILRREDMGKGITPPSGSQTWCYTGRMQASPPSSLTPTDDGSRVGSPHIRPMGANVRRWRLR